MVALTNNDQVNILSSVMAKRLGCKANLAADQQPVLSGPDQGRRHRRLRQSERRDHLEGAPACAARPYPSVHSVHKGAAEIIEAEALETSPLVGRRCANSICRTACALAQSTATVWCSSLAGSCA
jgi:trk system potassium uptake protein TrkA